ncbi:hypothetical protein [Brevibacillus sp. AY1]|uniref:hypothetical protein n=1 Tax=Brevibacillus sp. AY1 TaxID=2807621 RepID=UPI0024560E5E|nr:hypothetical protein [Brevibacillus sp. AY1]MDH4618255.1 hypothetical protein [Brevibacillus sp. AY1]
MEVTIQNHKFYYGNNNSSIEQVLTDIECFLKDKKIIIKNIIVNDTEVIGDYTQYINEMDIRDIERIQVVTSTEEEFVDEVMDSLSGYLSNVLPQLESLSKEFYQDPEPKTWVEFSELIEGLQWINQALNFLQEKNVVTLEELVSSLDSSIVNLLQAIEVTDTILVADIINYEISDILNQIHLEIKVH